VAGAAGPAKRDERCLNTPAPCYEPIALSGSRWGVQAGQAVAQCIEVQTPVQAPVWGKSQREMVELAREMKRFMRK